jgi:uncharacterized membrane protein (UPF0127 family)
MCVFNRTRERFVAVDVTVADTYLRRLVGLLGKPKSWPRPGRGLWIIPSHGVHTLGMMFPIDLIFLDDDRAVVHLEEYVKPFRISKVSLRATSVLELPIHSVYSTGTCVGDHLEFIQKGSREEEPEIPDSGD